MTAISVCLSSMEYQMFLDIEKDSRMSETVDREAKLTLIKEIIHTIQRTFMAINTYSTRMTFGVAATVIY